MTRSLTGKHRDIMDNCPRFNNVADLPNSRVVSLITCDARCVEGQSHP